MNRDEFEKEYVKRHMGYDPRAEESKLKSVERLRDIDGYSDGHIDLCWKVQRAKNQTSNVIRGMYLNDIEW